jgi:arsenite methyltransferase
MNNQSPTPIHEAVREHYAERARKSDSCCGSSDCCGAQNTLYPADLLTTVPGDIANFSLGCGDPVSLAEFQPGQTVLDLGSGGGLDCILAAQKVGETGRVIGVDMTPEMLEKARANVQRLGLSNVEFRQGFLEALPVEEASIDVVISNCVINLSPDKSQVFREIARVLRPGGRVAVSDIVTNGPLPEAVKNSLDGWAACVSGAIDVSDYVNAMLAAGLQDVQVTPTYLDEAMVDEVVNDLKGQVDLSGLPRETINQAVFSARITATRPESTKFSPQRARRKL